MIFYNSGLERKEREKVFKEAGGVWDHVALRKVILDRYELKHELDITMVDRAYKNRGRYEPNKTYVVHDPANGIEGTDLYTEDCDEEQLFKAYKKKDKIIRQRLKDGY